MAPKGKRQPKKKENSSLKPRGDIPVYQFTTKWGKDKEMYFASGDSGSESDDEHLVEDVIEEENKRLSTLKESDFKAFGSVATISKPIEVPTSLEFVEESLNQEELSALRNCIKNLMKDIVTASQALQSEFEDNEVGFAEKQVLSSILTNGNFYLYLVGTGFKSPFHPSLDHIETAKRYLPEIFIGVESLIDSKPQIQIEEQTTIEDKPAKHVPNHLKKIEDGEYRPVSRQILYNRVYEPNTPDWKKNPRSERRRKFNKIMHKYNAVHKRKSMPKDGIYKGENSGIDMKAVNSRPLKPAH